MTWFQTYIAVIKGYVGACVLFTPKAFANGGYLFSCIVMIISGIITSVCAVKLIRVAQHLDSYCYTEVVLKAIGPKGSLLLDFMIFMCQLCFTIPQISYCANSLKDLTVYNLK